MGRLWATGVACVFIGAAPLHAGGFKKAAEAALPRVVKLYGLGVGTQAGYGSGILVSADGLVLTVFSLLIDSEHIRAVTSDGTAYGAEVVHRDPNRQLALLRLKPRVPGRQAEPLTSPAETPGPFPYFDVACASPEGAGGEDPCADTLQAGDWVVAAGNPFKVADGAEPVSIAHGVLSGRTRLDARRKVKDFPYRGEVLVIDAVTSNPGAAGGALVDLDGRFVGMIGRVVISKQTHTHCNYAVPRSVLAEFLREAGDPARQNSARVARRPDSGKTGDGVDIGLRISRTGYRELPPFVERVRKGSPADRAGLQKDDLVLSINNTNVSDVREFDEQWSRLAAGEPVDLVIRRERRFLTVRVVPESP